MTANPPREEWQLLPFVSGPLPGPALPASYDPWLVALSYFVATAAAYTAIDLAGRVNDFRAEQRRAAVWLAGSAFAMGAGIWSMHFVAMLAYQLPIPVRYELWTTLASMLVAIVTSGFALFAATRGALSMRRLLVSGAVMGAGIGTMHYTGMYAMRLDALVMYYPTPWLLSIVNAVVCSTIAIWLVFRLGATTTLGKALAALVMGVAISGMHYIGMYATVCVSAGQSASGASGLDPAPLAATIAGVTLLIMTLALTVSMQSQLMSRTLREQNELLRREIAQRRGAEAELQYHRDNLQTVVEQRTRELTQAVAELRGSEARKGAMLESALDSVICMDSNGNVTEFNPAAEATFGYRRAEVVGKELASAIVPQPMRETHRRGLARHLATGEGPVLGKRLELPAMRADGTEFPAELAISVIQVDGKPLYAAYLRDVTERKQHEEAMRGALREKAVLLDEVTHRVKNNLQVVESLLDMQARRLGEGAARQALLDSRNRIQSMALIHQLLRHSEGAEWVDFRQFLEQLLPIVRGAFAATAGRVGVVINAADLRLPIDKAVSCGLIVNELVTNALKHGFPGERHGSIGIDLERAESGGITLSVSNDGVAVAARPGGDGRTSLGLMIVELLAGQIGGVLSVRPADPVRYAVRFPLL